MTYPEYVAEATDKQRVKDGKSASYSWTWHAICFSSSEQPKGGKKKGKGKGKGGAAKAASAVIDGISTDDMTREQVCIYVHMWTQERWDSVSLHIQQLKHFQLHMPS